MNDFVKPTSVESYQELRRSGELSSQQATVLQAFINLDYVPTRNEIKNEQLSDWENSTISGRVRELLDKGFLEVVGKREDSFSGRKSEILMVQNPEKEVSKKDNFEAGDVIFE